METIKRYPQIEELKNQIIDSALIFGTAVGFIVYLLSLTRIKETGFEIAFVTDFIVLFCIFGITIFRHKLSIKFKSYVTSGAIYTFILFDVIRLGVFSADKVLIVLIPFTSLLVYSLRKSILIFVFTVISLCVLAYMHLIGILVAPSQEHITLSAWIINILLLVIVAIIIAIIQNKFNLIYTDLISDLEKNNEIISEKERNYREIFNASTDAIFVYDLTGTIVDVNSSMLKMYGYDEADRTQLRFRDLSSDTVGNTLIEALDIFEKAKNGEPQLFDWQAKRKNGELFWIEVSLKKTNIGDYDRILAIVRDINDKKENALQLDLYRNHLKELVVLKTKEIEQTNEELLATNNTLDQQKKELVKTLSELKDTQQHLLQSEKKASLVTLVAGVAHEINNPLNFINGGLLGIEEYFQENLNEHLPNVSPLINAIQEGIDRASHIVTSLNHYIQRDNLPLNECNINLILDSCLILLKGLYKNTIEIKKDYTTLKYTLFARESQLLQVFMNILSNSFQAIENEGKIFIQTDIVDNFIDIKITDTGCGISKKNLVKIFDPFFTTKEPGKGTGLGLAITYNIIQEHKGTLVYESEIDKGTTAYIKLPLK
jgi:PAS domain S-box-containing protein